MTNKSNLFQWRRVKVLSATFFCITLALLSCKKKETTIGKDAFDPANLLNSITVDTFQLKTYTFSEDSVFSRNQQNALLGAYNDPEFGNVNASFYTQISLDNPGSTSFGNAPTIDSLVLALQYSGYYGTPSIQTFEVYEITEALSSSTQYNNKSTVAHSNTDLVVPGKGTILPKPTATVQVGTDTTKRAAQLRLPLKNSFAQFLLDGVAQGEYTTQDRFRAYIKGLYVKVTNTNPATGQGSVLYFSLGAIYSKLTLYYKDDSGTRKEFPYLMTGSSVNFSHIDFDHTGKKIQDVINTPALGQKEFYAQAFTSRAVIEFPTLKNLPKNVIIHKASLILPVSHYTNDLLYPSSKINIGTRITDDNDTIYARANVPYDDVLKEYSIDVRQHLQQVLAGQIANRGLFIRPTFFNYTTERIIFNGPQTIYKKKPKLVVTYTTY